MTVWRSPVFLGLFGDPYLRNTPYEAGGDPQALVSFLESITQLLQPPHDQHEQASTRDKASENPLTFPLTVDQHRVLQTLVLPQLVFCSQWAEKGANVGDAAQFQFFLTEWKAELAKLQVGKPVLVPGGYVGTMTSHSIIYVVEKTSNASEEYSFTVCNKGPGAEMYHPCKVRDSADKIRVQSCIQISNISAHRFLDMAFWSLLFSLWVRKPASEYHRVEIIYDVLLPWLADDQLLPLAYEKSSQDAPTDWTSAAFGGAHTAQRSQLGFCKSVIEAVRYLSLRDQAFTNEEVEYTILYQMRYRLCLQMVKGLEIAENPAKAIPDSALASALQTLSTISLQDSRQGTHTVAEVDSEAVVGIYFTLATSAACRKLTHALTVFSESLHAANKKFVVIVVPVDQEQADYAAFVASLPLHTWLIVPFSEREAREKLVQTFAITKVPQLILRGSNGAILTPLGKELIMSDPTGAFYPWTSERFELPRMPLSVSEATCIAIGVKQIGLKTLKQYDCRKIGAQGLGHINKLMSETERLVESVGMIASSEGNSNCGVVSLKDVFMFTPHSNMELLQLQEHASVYAGNASELDAPVLSNFLDVPERITSIALAVAAFVRCKALCESLLKRAAEGSTSLRLSLHHKVLQLITSVLVEVLPVPEHIGADGTVSSTCIWMHPVAKNLQLRCLKYIHSLLMVLGSVWQSMEQPSRQFDSERALAALCALCIFDAVVRTPAADEPLEISLMMEEEDGYVLAHTFCKANISIKKLALTTEFARPNFCVVRGQVLAYLHSQDVKGKRQLFDYHMPDDKIEIKRYSTTILFFRRLMERYHYQLIDPDNQTPPTEMEALMEWFCSDTTPMAEDHPEVGMTRDLVMMVKFLATMETKEVELMKHRTANEHWQMWQLSFDDSAATHRRNFFGVRGLNQVLHGTLKWEVVNFRGSDQDIADVEVKGFIDRKVYFGEGPVVTSPANLSALFVKCSSNMSAGSLSTVITEDDIMHLTDLPTYNGTLSTEESEYLMSYLTVPYTRIPLVASFFSSQDRVTYLFNPMLQRLFRAILFEGGDWVAGDKADQITHIPLRKSNFVMHEEAVEQTCDARVRHQKCEDHLGTTNGLLLNELIHAPEAIVLPLLKMLDAIKELGEVSVHSADARFILFMIKLSVDFLRYVTYAIDQCSTSDDQMRVAKLEGYRSQFMTYAFGFAHKILNKWRQEAEEANNLQTECVIHSYLALLHVSLRCSEYDARKISDLLGSVAYVHNWHCFGMKVSTDGDIEKCGLTAAERLLRWLQAQGINTVDIDNMSLDKYLEGRPLYLKVGMQTIQAPSFVALRDKSNRKETLLPPGDVLEVEVFEIIQLHRRSIVQWLSSLPKANRNKVLGRIVQIALRSTEQTDAWEWIEESHARGAGKYSCSEQELKLDTQTGEILWRNDELKPVPDSMTQFADFMAVFGNKALHCGLVARQEHRLWISIVGTGYQLVEWDDPIHEIDQGVGAPLVFEPGSIDGPDDLSKDSREHQMYWECPACTCANINGDNPNATCGVCGTPRIANVLPHALQKDEEGQAKQLGDDGFHYLGKTFSRPFDIYAEKEHSFVDEYWFVDLIGNTLRVVYPPEPDNKKLPYTLFLPNEPYPANATRVNLIGLDRGSDDKDKKKLATFKEIVAYRRMKVVHIFALVSHGRRLYRKLIFTSNSRLSLYNFPPTLLPDQGPVDAALLRASGEPSERQTAGGSLVVLRKNYLLNGTEQFVPSRLLQGVVPSCLLENFRFWIGEDGRLRGDSVDSKSQWFRYRVEIELKESGQAFISRKSITLPYTKIKNAKIGTFCSSSCSSMKPSPSPIQVLSNEASAGHHPVSSDSFKASDDDIVQLMAMGFSYAGCGLALRKSRNFVDLAAQFLLDESNQMQILAAEEAAAAGGFTFSSEEQHEQDVRLLMSMEASSSQAVAEYALGLFAGDLELSKVWLLDPANLTEIQRVDVAKCGKFPTSAVIEGGFVSCMEVDDKKKMPIAMPR
uniref:ubiquitinyl hydrolase 1 n=1 Tax=Hyaloperonospora arabidopsidis (strain Emoy2) TaxID=559515 RepID=M4BT12_HYAAE